MHASLLQALAAPAAAAAAARSAAALRPAYAVLPRRWLHPDATGGAPSEDTIFALSSGAGRAAVAVIRLSGPAADAALARLLPPGAPLPAPRHAALRHLRHPATAAPLDHALCLRFPAPASATGQDVVELHLHGGAAVVRGVAAALGSLPGLRPAEAGEFTRRAFLGGRLDLTQVEGLADLLAADTEAQRAQALAAAGGASRRAAAAWRAALLTGLARVEAVIDFGEDDGIADEVAAGAAPALRALRRQLEAHLAAGAGGELVRGGVRVAIVGAPNAGKSSLLNALAGREAAIVSAAPGTTRDVLEVALDLGGYKVRCGRRMH
jgi:tRNA modification GTPase